MAIESNCLWIETIRKSTCNSCSVQKGCGHSLLNKVGTGRRNHMRVLLRDMSASDFSIDDEVEISIPEQVLVMGALLVYLLPLVTMLVGAILASRWWQGDMQSFIGAVLGFVLGIGAVRFHAVANRNNMDLQPVVMSKLIVSDTVQRVNPV